MPQPVAASAQWTDPSSLIKDRFKRIDRIGSVPVKRRDRLSRRHARQFLLRRFVADDKGTAAEGALRSEARLAAGCGRPDHHQILFNRGYMNYQS